MFAPRTTRHIQYEVATKHLEPDSGRLAKKAALTGVPGKSGFPERVYYSCCHSTRHSTQIKITFISHISAANSHIITFAVMIFRFLKCWLRPKKICLFPICCHFNQWVGGKFILYNFSFYFLSLQSIGRKELFSILFGAKFTSMHVLFVHYVTIFCFFDNF